MKRYLVEPGQFNTRSKDWICYRCSVCMAQFMIPLRIAELIEEDDRPAACPNCTVKQYIPAQVKLLP